jgi:hypothetical protein
MARVHTLRSISGLLLTGALAAGLSGCSVFGSSPAPSAHSARATRPGNATVIAEQRIAANWTTFFSGNSGPVQRVSLVEDGSVFLPIFEASDGSTIPVEATVIKVMMVSPTHADVRYAILEDGQPAMPAQTGVAVLVNGHWLVSTATLCNLLASENSGNRSDLPAVCRTPAGLVS